MYNYANGTKKHAENEGGGIYFGFRLLYDGS